MSEFKVNLGCGPHKLDGYENRDIKEGWSAYPLVDPDGSISEIRASHLLEHFPMKEVRPVLADWVRCLKSGGVLKLAVPDFRKIANDYLNGEHKGVNTGAYVMGGQSDEHDFHKCLFDEKSLAQIMQEVGLVDIQPWNDHADTCRLPISLNLQGTKPPAIESQTVQRSLSVVMSMPRLGFTHNFECAIKAFSMRGIEYTTGTGAYWSQVLTNIIEAEVAKGHDYLLTVDYDSWFTWDHVQALMELMELYPEADALVPVQVKRETDSPLWIAKNADGTNKTTISHQEYMQTDIMPIDLGHFGLTLFRTSLFEKIRKPWFKAIPGPDNRWDEGRTDADIYFWDNIKRYGGKAFLATHVNIGHIQQLCTFPGRFEDNFTPVHTYINDINSGQVPAHCKLEGK